jgi:ferric-dicitrate binding protein FerR (iron transport regulator)
VEIIFQIYDCRIGKYKLLKGLIELNYSSGARLIVSGPATFELLSESRVRVERGRVTAHMPTIRSRGFVVETPTAVATDLGTEFAIDVGD